MRRIEKIVVVFCCVIIVVMAGVIWIEFGGGDEWLARTTHEAKRDADQALAREVVKRILRGD